MPLAISTLCPLSFPSVILAKWMRYSDYLNVVVAARNISERLLVQSFVSMHRK